MGGRLFNFSPFVRTALVELRSYHALLPRPGREFVHQLGHEASHLLIAQYSNPHIVHVKHPAERYYNSTARSRAAWTSEEKQVAFTKFLCPAIDDVSAQRACERPFFLPSPSKK